MSRSPASVEDVLRFWFRDLTPKDWWNGGDAVDARVRSAFEATLDSALQCELYSWRESARGRLAEVIVLDQFSRNIHRGTPRAFAADPLALALAQEAVSRGADTELPADQRAFLYMPFMHSESPAIHQVAVALFSSPGMENNLDFEHKHKVIIDRFGRYPHRNEILGRPSTPEELEFLAGPNSSF